MGAAIERALMRVRPASLAVILKRAFRVKRRIVTLPDGRRLWLDPVSHLGSTVMREGRYEVALESVLNLLLRKGDAYFDVGANEGYFAVLAALRGAQVLAFEPQSRLIPVIEENLRLNGIEGVTIVNAALADKRGHLTLSLAPDVNNGASSFHHRSWFSGDKETVRVETLDTSLPAGRHRLIKIDCEGAERIILAGARQALRDQRFEFMVIDYHSHIVGPQAAIDIDRLLRENGYLLTQLQSGLWIYHLPGLESELEQLGPCKSVPPVGG
jgi:FkbM family methyltransferase